MKELQISNIRKMVNSGENREAIAKRIDSTLEEIFKEIAASIPMSSNHDDAVRAAKELIEIYTNEENHLEWHQSDMYGKIIIHNALLSQGQILTNWFSEHLDNDREITMNGVTMNIHEAIAFSDDLVRLHQSMTKRFFFGKMDVTDEVVSEPLADAMRQYVDTNSKVR
ncbi:hypothetical protein AAA536_07750 [Pseudomonas aeruginosa]|nr:hypothetical protein [Pseudomonas aeruginosa]